MVLKVNHRHSKCKNWDLVSESKSESSMQNYVKLTQTIVNKFEEISKLPFAGVVNGAGGGGYGARGTGIMLLTNTHKANQRQSNLLYEDPKPDKKHIPVMCNLFL